MALVYQLAEMRGMARLGGPYESLGLKDETPVTKGLHAAEAFLAKSSEIQQVIDHSMRDYKAFFRCVFNFPDSARKSILISCFFIFFVLQAFD